MSATPSEPATEEVTACLIVIGNEILSGRTRDANLSYLAKGLNQVGVQLREARVIPDIEKVIVHTVNECRAAFDYVFTTGGIGPTHDDITSASIAKAFGVALRRDPGVVAAFERYYAGERGIELNAARLRMADFPEGAEILNNAVTIAPGYRMENVFVFAGVPKIMQAMFDEVKHGLIGGKVILSRTVTGHLSEGAIAADLDRLQALYPDIDIGSYPFFGKGKFGTSIVMRGADATRLEAAAQDVRALMRDQGVVPVDGEPE